MPSNKSPEMEVRKRYFERSIMQFSEQKATETDSDLILEQIYRFSHYYMINFEQTMDVLRKRHYRNHLYQNTVQTGLSIFDNRPVNFTLADFIPVGRSNIEEKEGEKENED